MMCYAQSLGSGGKKYIIIQIIINFKETIMLLGSFEIFKNQKRNKKLIISRISSLMIFNTMIEIEETQL